MFEDDEEEARRIAMEALDEGGVDRLRAPDEDESPSPASALADQPGRTALTPEQQSIFDEPEEIDPATDPDEEAFAHLDSGIGAALDSVQPPTGRASDVMEEMQPGPHPGEREGRPQPVNTAALGFTERRYPAGQLPLPPRAQAVEERLQGGEHHEIDEEIAAAQAEPIAPMMSADDLPEPREAQLPPSALRDTTDALDITEGEPWYETGDEAPRAYGHLEGTDSPGDLEIDDEALAALDAPEESAPAIDAGALPPQPSAKSAGADVLSKADAPVGAMSQDTLDEGLPSASDIGDARTRDDIRNPFRAIGRALQVAAGRNPGARATPEGDTLQARRDAGLTRAQGLKREARAGERQDATLAASQQSAQAQRAIASRSADQRDRQISIAEAAAQRQAASGGARDELLREQALTARSTRELGERRRTPGTDEASAARAELQTMVEAFLPPGASMDRAVEALVGPGNRLDDLSAEQVERITARGPEWLRASLARGARRGTGTGAPRDRSALLADADAAGIPGATARAMNDRQLAAAIEQRGRRPGGNSPEGTELIPGSDIRAGAALPRGEDRAWRTGYASAQRSMSGLRRIGEIGQRYGRTAAFSPEARAQVTPELTLLRAMVAQMGGTGVINPTEVPAINAALPNPQDPELATFGQFEERLQQWRSILEDGVRAQAVTLGVDEADTDRLVQGLRAGRVARSGGEPGAAPQAAPASTGPAPGARVRLPDGREARIVAPNAPPTPGAQRVTLRGGILAEVQP